MGGESRFNRKTWETTVTESCYHDYIFITFIIQRLCFSGTTGNMLSPIFKEAWGLVYRWHISLFSLLSKTWSTMIFFWTSGHLRKVSGRLRSLVKLWFKWIIWQWTDEHWRGTKATLWWCTWLSLQPKSRAVLNANQHLGQVLLFCLKHSEIVWRLEFSQHYQHWHDFH